MRSEHRAVLTTGLFTQLAEQYILFFVQLAYPTSRNVLRLVDCWLLLQEQRWLEERYIALGLVQVGFGLIVALCFGRLLLLLLLLFGAAILGLLGFGVLLFRVFGWLALGAGLIAFLG